jgi:hypothetical protein
MAFLTELVPFFKALALLPLALAIFKHIKHYSYLKKAAPMAFTIGTKTNVGSTLFTTGRVVSINLLKVIIDGRQVNDVQTEFDRFEIYLHKISGINPHPVTPATTPSENTKAD